MTHTRWILQGVAGLSTLGVLTLLATPAISQSTASASVDDDTLVEILVTAERRSVDLQNTPIVISAVSGKELLEDHITSMDALSQTTPSFSVDSQAGGMFQNVNIRGIGQTALGSPAITPGVAVFRDGLLQGETTALDVPLYDIADVEVLEGPQGTLGGGSSTAGAVQINSANPNFRGLNGFIDTQFGNFGEKKVEGAVNLTVNDTLAFRIAFNEELRNSFYRDEGALLNEFPGAVDPIVDPGSVKDTNVRFSTLWKPIEDFQALFKYEYNLRDTGGTAGEPITGSYTSLFGGASCGATGPNGSIVCPGAGTLSHSTFYYPTETPFVLDYASTNGEYRETMERYNLDLQYTLPDGIEVRSLSGLQHLDVSWIYWQSYSPANDGTVYHELGPGDYYYSEELNVISPTTGKFSWIAGAFLFYRNTPVERLQPVYLPPYAASQTPVAEAVIGIGSVSRIGAVFANANWQFTDTLQLQVGVRGNWDNNFNYESPNNGVYVYPFTPPNTLPGTSPGCVLGGSKIACVINGGQYHDGVPTGKVDLNWTPIAGQNFYAFYARGYKAGGANGDYTSANPTFKPEIVNDFELGWKGKLLDDHILTQVGAYYMRYLQMQYPIYDIYDPAVGNGDAVNLDPSKIKGIAASMQSKFGHFGFNLGFAYNDSSLGAVTALNNAALPTGTKYAFNTPSAPAQCGATPTAGCFNYLPYEQTVSGEQIPFAPKITANAAIDYGLPVAGNTLRPRLTLSYVGSQYASFFQTPYYFMPSRTLLGANVDYEVGPWLVDFYGTNLTNRLYISGNDGTNQYYGAPRQWGFRLNYAFGSGGG